MHWVAAVRSTGSEVSRHSEESGKRHGGYNRDESPEQRADRNFGELLQELRVAQTGVQMLFGFLLTLAFSQRFEQLDAGQRRLYVVVLCLAVAATCLLIGPASVHRILFRQGLKEQLVQAASLLATSGLFMLMLSVAGSVLLVVDVVFGARLAAWIVAFVVLFFLLVWYVLPFVLRARGVKSRGTTVSSEAPRWPEPRT